MAFRDFGAREAMLDAWEDLFLGCLSKLDAEEARLVKDWPPIRRMGSQGYTAQQAAEKYLAERNGEST